MGEEKPNIGILLLNPALRHIFPQVSQNHTTSCSISIKIGMNVPLGYGNQL